LAGSFDAILRAGQSAVDLAIQTNTEIVTFVNEKIVYRSAEQLKKERELNSHPNESIVRAIES